MVSFYWFWVWSVPAFVALLLTAPVNLGYVPAHPAWRWILAVVTVALWFLAGRLGMRLVLRVRDLPRAWVTPTLVNVFMVLLWTVAADHHIFGLLSSLTGLLSISLGMWVATRARRN